MTTSQADINTNSNSSTAAAGMANNSTGGMNCVDNAVVGGSGGNSGNGGSSSAGGGGGGAAVTGGTTNLSSMNINSNGSTVATNSASAISEMGKRKKLKSRNSTTLPASILNSSIGSGGGGYSKDHLDAWLETCLKDASTTQLSSSSEFLDYNPTVKTSTSNSANNLNQKNLLSQQQQQQSPIFNMANMGQQQQQQQQAMNLQQQQQQQQFAMRTSSNPLSNNLPNTNNFNFPFSQGFQRPMPNFMKPSSMNAFNNRYSMMFPSMSTGGYYPQNDGSQDFASLPPMVNIMGGGSGGNSSEHENNSTDVLDGSASNPNISRGFRFSDPCLLNPSDNDSKVSGQNTPDRRANLPNDMDQSNKFFNVLMEQIQLLHETNSKICRDLHEAKGAYTPGIMTDVVREVKEAARVREDALLNRVKALVEERQWSMNESNLRMMRDIEELKSQVHHLRSDRKETNKRLNHLEAENKYMRQMLAALYHNRNSVPDIIYENETLRTRKSFPHTRRSHQPALNLHYGTVHHQSSQQGTSSLDEQEEEPLHIIETPSTTSTADIAALTGQRSSDMRHSFSSSDGGSINGGGGSGVGGGGVTTTTSGKLSGPIMSPPNFALISSASDDVKRKKDKNPKKLSSDEGDTGDMLPAITNVTTNQDLRRELNEAVIARKEADDRIIALEKLVKTLQVNATHPPSSMANNNSNNNNSNTTNTTTTTTTIESKTQKPQLANGEGGSVPNKSKTNSGVIATSGGGHHHSKTPNRRSTTTSSAAATTTAATHKPKWSTSTSAHHPNHHHSNHHQSATTAAHSSPVKLSVAGPITDL
ncbi:rho GTPase-activating protein gacU isoform X5 [Musca domestica]|uniref:Rho GTPase-activating protein gacU isoform X5 n=1 Tax=Musca domestica TaxID=7370 RepID=A0ABM3VBD3_MUSDO|nr:rho GTPase-activating protein gacU isoform X5 [Musca domestica]